MRHAENILIQGLKAGYAGGEAPREVFRGTFAGKESSSSFPDAEYNDQWFFKRTGGGQDIAREGDETVTRVFAGGIVDPEKLQGLHITEKDVLTYHKQKLSELVERTRLHEPVVPDADGDWQYQYQILTSYPDVPLSIGVETIEYKGQEVFVHVFVNTPIA